MSGFVTADLRPEAECFGLGHIWQKHGYPVQQLIMHRCTVFVWLTHMQYHRPGNLCQAKQVLYLIINTRTVLHMIAKHVVTATVCTGIPAHNLSGFWAPL